MKTDELISMLASTAVAVEPDALRRRYATALGWGAFGSTLLMAVMFGVRPDLAEAARLPMFWVKRLDCSPAPGVRWFTRCIAQRWRRLSSASGTHSAC